MPKLARKAPKARGALQKTYRKIETKLMAVIGRATVRVGSRRAKVITARAAKAAAIAAGLAAAKVVYDELRGAKNRAV